MCRRRSHRIEIENHRNRQIRTFGCAELHVMCSGMGNFMAVTGFHRRIFAAWDGEHVFCATIVLFNTAIIISDIFSCVRIIVIRRCSVCREDTTSRNGLWQGCLASLILRKAVRFLFREEKAVTGTGQSIPRISTEGIV